VTAIALGPFDLIEPIARGGMGEVWRGRHRGQRLEVAIKVITGERGRVARFRDEVRALARLEHPRVILVLDQGEVDEVAAGLAGERLVLGQPYLAMELVSGGTLADRRFRRWDQVDAVLRDILDGLAHAHARGVIHRDLKPANVLFAGPSDVRPGLRLSDFGIARALRARPGQVRSAVVGTLGYMAPEQLTGRFADEGPWTDLYALGAIAYQLVGGRTLWPQCTGRDLAYCHVHLPAPPARPRIPVPDGLQAWLDRLLAKRPEDRFELAADAAAALAALPPPPVVRLGRGTPTPETTPSPGGADPDPAATAAHRLAGAGLGLWGLRPIPLVGRERERAELRRALVEVAESGEPRVVVVRGGAGIGKSRLVEDLVETAHERGEARALRAGHSPIPNTSDGLRGLVARALAAEGLERDSIYKRARRLLRHHQDGADDLDAAALTEVAFPGDGDVKRVRFSGPEERYQVVTRLLARLAGHRPIIAWFDDVHHGADTLRYLIELAGSKGAPVLAVATCTDDRLGDGSVEGALLGELDRDPTCRSIAVGPLPGEARRDLVSGSLRLSAALTRQLADRAEGNPLFAVQLVGDWVKRGILELSSAGFELAPGASTALPDDIHQLWSERLESLARQVDPHGADDHLIALELAAALGQQIQTGEWRAACAVAGLGADDRLIDQLLGERMALSAEAGWEFSHGLVRESLERRARDGGRWRAHHRACARMLSALYPDTEPRAAARQGRHLAAAGDLEDAMPHLLASAEAYRLAGEHALAHALHDEREAALDELGVPQTDRRRIAGSIQRAATFQQQGRVEEALAELQRATAAATAAAHHDLIARAETVHGRLHFDMSAPVRARQSYERALRLFEKTGADSAGMAACLNGLGSVCVWLRELDAASRHLERAHRLHETTGDLFELGQTLRILAHVRHCERDYEEAAILYRRARSCFDHAGCTIEVANCINDLGELARARGELDEAEARYREAGAIYGALGSPAVMTTNYNLALVLLHRGHMAEAREIFAAELDKLEDRARTVDRLWLRAGLLACAAAERSWPEWDEHAAVVEALVAESGFVDEDIAELAVVTGGLTATAGEAARARRIYALARDQLERMDHRDRLEGLRQAMAALDAAKC
jgi:tetratricopeptide (TPR) repeat protein